jgi:hypothetical protein
MEPYYGKPIEIEDDEQIEEDKSQEKVGWFTFTDEDTFSHSYDIYLHAISYFHCYIVD